MGRGGTPCSRPLRGFRVKQRVVQGLILSGMLLGLPLLGLALARIPLLPYLEFPPRTRFVEHAPFSWAVFCGYAVLILAMTVPLAVRAIGMFRRRPRGGGPVERFPVWAWIGLFWGVLAWVLAWSRLSFFEPLQAHTFMPLWLSYIVVVNGLSFRRTGRCLLLNSPRALLWLFPLSALFWWFFEYLNRFVQNWYYTGVAFGPGAYFCLATMSFSTVLPAVVSTREWLLSYPWIRQGFANLTPLRLARPRLAAGMVLALAAAGLAGIGLWPDILFPLLWVAPLLILVALQTLWGRPHVLSPLARGEWTGVVSSAVAALFCGFFWEMWNALSLAKWEYAVPYVHRFQIFEMPLLGYAGYLPFGLECIAVAGLIMPWWTDEISGSSAEPASAS